MKYLGKVLIIATLLIITSATKVDKAAKTDYLVTIITDYGDVKIVLFDDTPIHKKNFIEMVKKGIYSGNTFHRVINQFMIQGGEFPNDKKPQGWDTMSFVDKSIPNEIRTNHLHKRGALAAARPDNPEKRSDKTQFFIVQPYSGAHFLDNQYTVFGQVMAGMEVVDKIAATEVIESKPIKNISFRIRVDKVLVSDLQKFYGQDYLK